METEEDPPMLALASSLATSTLGASLSSTLGGATPQERLGLLVGKLGHALREVRLRALRNLRLKLATPELLLPSSPTAMTAPVSPQGLLRGFFAAHGPQLYAHLRAALLDEGDEALRGEALMLLAEVCRQPGQQEARRGLVAAGVADALAEAPGLDRHKEARALAHDIRQTLLLAASLLDEEDDAAGAGGIGGAGGDVSMLGASVASGSTQGERRRRESLPIPPLPTSSSSSGAAADGERMMMPPTEEEAGASTTRFSLSSSMPAPPDPEPAPPQQQQQQQPPQPQQLAHLLLFEGWKFPPVPLGRADERRLFEFQVRFGTRTDAASALALCRRLRTELLEDYPAEVMLQKSAIIRQLLRTVRRILVPDGAGADEADNHEDDADTSLSSAPSTASLPMRPGMLHATTPGEGGADGEQQQQPAVKPEAVVLEALATLDALSRKLSGALRLHAQPAFKPPAPLAPEPSASITTSQPSSYPAGAAPGTRRSTAAAAAALEGSTGAVGEEEALALSLSLEGFAFLAIDSILALLHLPHTAPAARPASAAAAAAARAIPTRALAVIHTLLPYLTPPAPTPAHAQRLLALFSSLAPALAAPPSGPGGMGDALPLLALRLLELLPGGDELPGLALEIPGPVAALALAAAAHWPARFGPLVRALRGPGPAGPGEDGDGVMAGIEAARRLVARAKPVLSLLLAATQGDVVPAAEEGDSQDSYGLLPDDTHAAASPAAWLSTILRDRIEPALPLLALAPDGDLVLLALHLAARALAVSTLGQGDSDDVAPGGGAFAAGLKVVLALLALPCDDNRLAAHRELARLLQQRGPASAPPLLAALAARLPATAAPSAVEAATAALTGPAAPRALARAVLGREEGAALLRHLLVFGVRDPVDGVRAAAWDALGGALGVSGEGEGCEEEGETEEDALVRRRLPPLLPLLVAARGQADAEEGRGAAAAEAATVPLGTPGPRGLLVRFIVQVAKAAAVQATGEEGEEEDWALLAPLLDLFSPIPTLRLGARRQAHALLLQRPGGAAAWPKNCMLRPEAAFEQDEEADDGASGGWAGLRSAAAAAWAGGARYGGAAAAAAEEAAASPARLGALCDLLLDPGALREAEQLAAARDLTLLLTMRMGRSPTAEDGVAGLLPPWASTRVLGAARRLLDGATPALEEAGAELLLVVAWGGSRLGSHDLQPFVPFLFHAAPAIRGTVRLALLPALFGRSDYWAAAGPGFGAESQLFSDRAPDEVLARVPSAGEDGHALTYLLPGPPTRDGGEGRPPATTLMLPAFVAGCFRVPTFPGAGAGRTTPYPRPLVWVHPLPPVDPSRDATAPTTVTAPLLPPLLDALIPLWYSLSLPEAAADPHGATGDSPLLSPVPPVALTPQGPRVRAAALATALREAGSHSALSAALQALTQAILAAPAVADAFLGLEWTDALGRLLRAPPATRRDDRLLRDALFLLTHHLVPCFTAAPCSTSNRHRRTQLLALAAVGMECFVPVLQRRPPKSGRPTRVLAATAGGLGGSVLGGSLLDPFAPTASALTAAGAAHGTRVAAQQQLLEEDLVDEILAFFLALCDAHAGLLGSGGSGGGGGGGVAGVLATRCPLVPTVAALLVEPRPTAPPPSPRTTALGLRLLARLLPAAGPQAPSLVSPRLLLRLAGREHDPEAFKGSAVARAALRCLRGWLSLSPPSAAAEGPGDGDEPAAASSSSSSSLLRFISDKQATVRALAYGCLAQAVRRGDGLQHGWLLGTGEEEEGADEPSVLELAVQVLLDPREAPAVAAEAAGVVAAAAAMEPPAAEGDNSGSAAAVPVEAMHVAALLQAAGEALAPGPWAQPARAPAVLGALHALLRRRLFAAPTAAAVADGVDGTLLLQLMWQQGLPQDLIRLLDRAPALRQLHDAAAYAVLNTAAATAAQSSAAATLLAAAAAEAPGAQRSGSAYFLGRHAQRGAAAAAAALAAGAESWQASVVEESWWAGGGEAVAAAGHAEAMSLLRRLLLEQRRRKEEEEEEQDVAGGESRAARFELVDEAALAGALVACLEYWSRQAAPATGEEEAEEDGGWVLISDEGAAPGTTTARAFSPSAQLALTEACALGMEAFPRLLRPRRKADGAPSVLVSRAADVTAAVVARLLAACSSDEDEDDMGVFRLRRAALGLLSLLLTAPAGRPVPSTPLGGSGSLWPLLVARHRVLCGPAAFWREQASERALVTSCLAGLLEARAAGVEPGAAPALVAFVLGRVRAVYEALLVEGAGLSTASAVTTATAAAAGSKSAPASTVAAKKKAAGTAGTTAAVAQRRKKSNLLRGLNARLQQQKQQQELPAVIGTSSGRPSAWAAAAEEGARLLTFLRALLLAADGTAQEAAVQGGLADLARSLWPYALRLEEGARGQRGEEPGEASASTLSSSVPPTLLEALLGALCNYAAFHESAKLSLLEQAPGASSLLQRALRLALRDAEGEAATRPAVVELAMALVRSLALTAPGRKQLVQTQALAAPGGCCALPRLLRGAGNRLLRPGEVAADPARRVRLLSVLRLLVSVTLAAEGQRMLVAQCPGLPQLLDELLDFLHQPPPQSKPEGGGGVDADGEEDEEDAGEALRTEACAQLCYLLRNLAFLRGQSKAQVAASPRLLRFLVLDGLPHPSLAVRFPATVAVWSLLYHSERSLAALLRGTLAPGQVRACLDHAAHRLEVDEEQARGQEQEDGDDGDEARAAMVAGTGRALAHIERLLYSSTSKDPPGGPEEQEQGAAAAVPSN